MQFGTQLFKFDPRLQASYCHRAKYFSSVLLLLYEYIERVACLCPSESNIRRDPQLQLSVIHNSPH